MIESVAAALAWFFGYVLCYLTGELLLWVGTLGRRKPRVRHSEEASATRLAILEEGSFWLGAVFWASVIAVLTAILQ